MRPHTDATLGHCSYLNTCYSEPTYAHSPSIPAYPGSTSSRGPVSLPSGLGAGGRGKEKAPCRYLHYEVDWDPSDADSEKEKERERERQQALRARKKSHHLDIGLGPLGPDTYQVCAVLFLFPITNGTHLSLKKSFPHNGSIVTYANLTIPCWESSMLSWQIPLGTFT